MGKVTDYWMNEYSKDKSRDMIENIEQKLDKIIATSEDIAKTNKECHGVLKELLEKLTNSTAVINAPITAKSEDKNVGVDINKHLYNLANKVQRRKSEPKKITDEEFIKRLQEIDWSKIVETKPTIKLLDNKGKDIGVKCDIKDDGSVVCEPMTESRTVVGWSLKKENTMNDDKIFKPAITELKKEVQYIKDRYNAPVEILEELIKKVHIMLLDYEAAYEEQRRYSDRLAPAIPITKTIDVFKQQVDTNMFVYVGTITDNVLTLNQSAVVLETYVTRPSTYFTDWFVKNNNPAIGCQWLDVHPSNTVNEILIKEKYMNKFVTTGYLTDEGRAVYYDQYL